MFEADKYISPEQFQKICRIRTFHPDLVQAEADRRGKAAFQHDRIVFAAADHNARMITEYGGDEIGLSDRRDYLARLVCMLDGTGVDGLEASPDIIEDLLILSALKRQEGESSFLDDKVLVGTVNRGGLKGSCWEMDDFADGFTIERLSALHMNGAKFMLRINPDAPECARTIRCCAETTGLALKEGLHIFIEALFCRNENGHPVMKKDLVSLVKAAGVVSALGPTACRKWIELPLCPEYERAAASSTCSFLVVPDEREHESRKIVAEYTEQADMRGNVRGILLGRNVMFSEAPGKNARMISEVWHKM